MDKICLVHMPFSLLGNPSMALSVLKGELVKAGLPAVIEYGNLRLAHKIGVKNYSNIMFDVGAFNLLGELAFCRLAGFSKIRNAEEYFAYARSKIQLDRPEIKALYDECYARFMIIDQFVDSFLEEMTDAVLAHNPAIVGCDITFQQRNASLALLRKIKERNASIVTVLGGNSCTGSCGQALADYMPAVDFVFSGEADDLFPAFCRAVLAGKKKQEIHAQFPSALIAGGNVVSWGRAELKDMAIPDFDDYFAELRKFDLSAHVDPCLLIEGSRGCWWGEVKRCTFCGIHTSEETLHYREKSAQAVFTELAEQSKRYGIQNFSFTDCVLSQHHIRELLPVLAAHPVKFQLFAEVKTNIKKAEIQALREAGFIYLQPGIESIQDDLLRLMNKGSRAIRQVEFLKNCRTYGIKIIWNLLKAMPGDKAEWYDELDTLLPLISHLHPPTHFNRIIFQRSSAYVKHPESYGLKLAYFQLYSFIGQDEVDFIERTAEFYQAQWDEAEEEKAAKEALWQSIDASVKLWTRLFDDGQGDRLAMIEYNDRLEINDLRAVALKRFYTLTGAHKALYLAADQTISLAEAETILGKAYPLAQITAAMHFLIEHKLLLRLNGQILALAVSFPAKPHSKFLTLPSGRVHFERRESINEG